MPTFSADQIVSKTLIAKKPVPVYDLPFYDKLSKQIAVIKPGNTIGVVFSWVGGTPGKPLNWEFKGNAGKMYYVAHVPGYFNVTSLREQGVQTTDEIQQEQKESEQTTGDKLTAYFKKSGNVLLYGGLAIVALSVFLKNRK
jgi:hypothetical protein